jgi:dTDP-4-dehydrorhamnose reductase
MRMLLIGRTGQLGGDLLRENRDFDIAAPERGELDITRSGDIAAAMARYRPQLLPRGRGPAHHVQQ